MQAIILQEAGDASQLQLTQLPTPYTKDDEVLIKVKAISINPVDIKTRIGKSLYNELKEKNPAIILGWDISGVAEAVGKNVADFKTGDEVLGRIAHPSSR